MKDFGCILSTIAMIVMLLLRSVANSNKKKKIGGETYDRIYPLFRVIVSQKPKKIVSFSVTHFLFVSLRYVANSQHTLF